MKSINFCISSGSIFITSSGDMFTNRSFAAAFSSAYFLSLSSLVSALAGGGIFGNGGGPPICGGIGPGIIIWSLSLLLLSLSFASSFANKSVSSFSSSSSPVKNPIIRSNSVSSAFISTDSPVGPTKTPVSVPSNLFCGIPYAVFILTTSRFESFPCGQSVIQ